LALFTDEEQFEFVALMEEQAEHGKEKLEALDEENRILLLLLVYLEGTISALEFARRVRGAVPDPLAG
jgi:hypothetical protein